MAGEMRTFMGELADRLNRPELRPPLARRAGTLATQTAEQTVKVAQAVKVAQSSHQPQSRAKLSGEKELSFVEGFLNRHVVWPSEATLHAGSLVVAAYHAKKPFEMDNGVKVMVPAWPYMFRLWIGATRGGAGKSHCGKMIGCLCPQHKQLIKFTEPGLIELIGQQATIQISEANIKMTRRLIPLVNAGYEHGPTAVRKDHGRTIETPFIGPVIMDGLNWWLDQPDPDIATLASRCIRFNMLRAPNGYRPPRMGHVEQAVARQIGGRMHEWAAQEVDDGMGDIVPELPAELDPRRASLWEPIMACALRAGGPWPQRAWDACLELETGVSAVQDEAGDTEAEDLAELMKQWTAESRTPYTGEE